MESTNTYYIDLITRYLYGDATPEEILELEAWVKSDPAHAAEFSVYQKTWMAVEQDRLESSTDVEQDWRKVRSRITAIEPGTRQISQFSIFLNWSVRIAAILFLAAIPTFFLYRYLASPQMNEFVATTGISEQTLPDGTVVTLNEGSKLICPSRFGSSERRVRLVGEGWFEVTHDAAHPFIVEAGDLNIKVLGTTFLVNTATIRNSHEVILASGRVEVTRHNHPDETLVLQPGEKAETAGTGLEKSVNSDANFLAWKTGRMVFDNTPLNEVAALITKVYHKKVILAEPGLSHCRITATFEKQTPQSVLNVLAATLNLKVTWTQAAIELSGTGCRPE